MIKRLIDIVVSVVGLLVLTPVLAICAVLVELDSPGPVFYRGERVGKDGVTFKMYKLRTMVPHADRLGSQVTQGRDPRITRVGRVLRKWKLDELPQLINVLRADMSLVGPRPEAPCYVRYYTPEQRQVLRVRPGITGVAQVQFRHEEALLQHCTDLEAEYVAKIMPQKLCLDLTYVESRSLLRDLGLIVQTVAVLFQREALG